MARSIRDENVLVTGGAGFIGSALVQGLLERDNQVTVLDNFVTGDIENLGDVARQSDLPQAAVDDRIDIVSGDLLRFDVEDLLTANDIDYVFDLAAEPFIPSCYDRPRDFFAVNANGTLRLLLACKEAGVDRILHYSSSEVYGTAQSIPMDESHRLFPQSTYAVSKLAAERLCFTLYHEQDIPVIILRQFNCYGPRETHPYIVPELIAQLASSSRLELGNTTASRDLTYVDDAVRGALKLITCPEAEGEVVNLGYGEDVSVEELAHQIAALLGRDEIEIDVQDARMRPLDVEQLCCDYSKAARLIDYSPETSLESGLRRTVDWYRENGEWVWEKTLEDQLWTTT